MIKKKTTTALTAMTRWLRSRNGVRAAMLAAGSSILLGATFLMLSAYFSGEERAVRRTLAEAGLTVAEEAAVELEERKAHLALLQKRLATHQDGAAPFRLIEEHLDAEVGFSNIEVHYADLHITFAVHGPNAGSIARQAAAFENDSRITSVLVSPLGRDRETGRYEGTMTLRIDPEILLAFPHFVAES